MTLTNNYVHNYSLEVEILHIYSTMKNIEQLPIVVNTACMEVSFSDQTESFWQMNSTVCSWFNDKLWNVNQSHVLLAILLFEINIGWLKSKFAIQFEFN